MELIFRTNRADQVAQSNQEAARGKRFVSFSNRAHFLPNRVKKGTKLLSVHPAFTIQRIFHHVRRGISNGCVCVCVSDINSLFVLFKILSTFFELISRVSTNDRLLVLFCPRN